MVLLGDKKYACETCIKGHRSSSCKHTDRPLFEIKKKGRPVTQCEHCRELRKTKQVHVKCVCESKDDVEGLPGPSKKGGKKVPASAAFPSGLPAALGASVASDGSDSDYASEVSANVCTCKSTGSCHCCTPRTVVRKRRSKASHNAEDAPLDPDQELPHQPASLVANAHSRDYRPVLPRPTSTNRASPPRSTHSPSGGSHGSRSQIFYSPYERAYEQAHGADIASELQIPPSSFQHQLAQPSPLSTGPLSQGIIPPRDDISALVSWLSTIQQPSPTTPLNLIGTMCDCGPGCACPGCIVHRGASAHASGLESCSNPTTCNACLECTMQTIVQNPVMDEWLRQLNVNTTVPDANLSDPSSSLSPASSPQSPFVPGPNQPQQQGVSPDLRFDPGMWQTYALWNNLQGQPAVPTPPEDCCGGRCKCPPGMCACPADCCGCCQGCSCTSCLHQDPTMGTGKTLTFALSGERAPCCGGTRSLRAEGETSNHAGPSTSRSAMQGHPSYQNGPALDLRGVYEWDTPSLDVPRVTLSRASSSSSRSSSQHSFPSSSQGSAYTGSPVIPQDNTAVRSCCASMETMDTSFQSHSPVPYPSPATTRLQERTFNSSQFNTDASDSRMF